MEIMLKPRAKKEQKSNRRSNTTKDDLPASRQDTWADRSIPLYDRNGNQVGTYNDNSHYYENDRR